MESDRRSFLGAMIGIAAAPVASEATSVVAEPSTGERAFFKWNGTVWGRIDFADLKVGDRVLMVDFGEWLNVAAMRVDAPVVLRDFDGVEAKAIATSEPYDAMPKIWGIHDDVLDANGEVKPEVASVRAMIGSIDEQFLKFLPMHRMPFPHPTVSRKTVPLTDHERQRLMNKLQAHYGNHPSEPFVGSEVCDEPQP
jgi:hypothetical protein